MNPLWYVYVLLGTGRSIYYVGATNDLARRLRQHNGKLSGGAKFTRRYRPWGVVKRYGPYADRSEAQKVEFRVKKLRGPARTRWVEPVRKKAES